MAAAPYDGRHAGCDAGPDAGPAVREGMPLGHTVLTLRLPRIPDLSGGAGVVAFTEGRFAASGLGGEPAGGGVLAAGTGVIGNCVMEVTRA
jgi:hypothetical protein